MSGSRISDMTAIEALDLPSDAYVPVISEDTGSTNYKYELGKAVTDPFVKKVSIQAFGGAGDFDGSTGTDNLQPLLDAIDSFTYFPDFEGIAVGPEIMFGPGDYYFSDTINLKKIVKLTGIGSGQNNFNAGTRFHFPADVPMVIVNRTDTSYDEKTAVTSAADGTTIHGIHFIPAAGGTDEDAHGIWLRARANIERCQFGESLIAGSGPFAIAGNAIHIVASVSGSGALYGNANNWRIFGCYVERCNGHGLYVQGTDVNAGKCEGFETRNCGGCGVIDLSGLGNTYSGLNLAGYANASPLKGRVTHSGRHYQLISATAGVGASTTPGTNDLVWYDMGTGSTWPTWSSSGTYTPDIPILVLGTSNRTFIGGNYTEGGVSHVQAPAVAVGGQTGYTRTSSVLHCPAIGVVNGIFGGNGVGGHRAYSSGGIGHTNNGDYAYTLVGGPDPGDSDVGVAILEHRKRVDGAISWVWGWDGKDQRYRFLNQRDIWRITGPNTARTFGRSAAVPYYLTLSGFAIRDPNNSNNERIINIASAAPTTGDRAAGELVLNVAPGTGGNMGWSCTTGHATTGGTWYKTGLLFLDGSATYDPPSIAASGVTTTTVTVTGAALGDFAQAGFSLSLGGLMMTAEVSAADTVTVTLFNPTGSAVDIASGTLRARVIKKP